MADLPRTADVVVVGGGVHGASLVYHLARRKAGRVVLVERKFLASGPTGRSSALVRRFYAMDLLTRTAHASAEVFQRWGETVGGDPGFRPVGLLWLAGAEVAPHLRANVARAQALGVPLALLTPEDARGLVPAMAVDDVALVAHEPASGYADATATTNAFAERARALGASVVQYVGVEAILTAGGKVAGVRTAAGEISAPAVAVCAGLWADRLLAPLGIEVPIAPTRHQMCFFRRPPGFAAHPAVIDRPNMTYMRPETGNLTIHGLAAYQEVVDPDHYNEGADADEIVRNAELIARRFPSMEHGLAMGGYSGVYDVTPDHQPVLGPIAEYAGLVADFGWSGHGFKHAPQVGDILAEVVLNGRAPGWDLAPFRWTRFREGDLLPPASATAPPHPERRAATPGSACR
ncbi:MAG TPA: FAD-binding oxidoreductase [Methylomirabilota bacterium]|jgi:sarcosine oxidase subunit beta|nr:FAD-binding oxidoreductase [Methylomirabilota bacterium]